MSSVDFLLINGQVFCLLVLAIPRFAWALHLLLNRPSRWTNVRKLLLVGLVLVAFLCYRTIAQLAAVGQDIN